jgi:hypothetical protein
MSDSEPDENFVTPYGSPSERQHEPEADTTLDALGVCDETIDVFIDGTPTEQSQRNRAGSYSVDNEQRGSKDANSKAKHRLGSIDICKDIVSSAPPCTSRSVSLDDSVKSRISQTYDVNWEGATRQRGVVLVSDGQSEYPEDILDVFVTLLRQA